MNRHDAINTAATAKDLFRFVTAAQEEALAEILLALPDNDPNGRRPVEYGNAILRAVAARAGDECRLSLPDVRKAVEAERGRRGLPVYRPVSGATIEFRQQHAAMLAEEERWARVERWVQSLPDPEVDRLTRIALAALSAKSAVVRGMFERRTVKDCRLLAGLAHEAVKS